MINSKNENLNLAHFDKNILSEIHNEYIEKISQINNSDKAFTDKAPLNFRFIGFIKIIFPNSKIINCRRNSLDICWSNFKNYFGESLPFTNNLVDLANYYKIYEDLISFFGRKNSQKMYIK